MTLASRTFARLCWLHVPTYTQKLSQGESPTDDDTLRALIEKRSMINLVSAFNLATKHYLRGEAGSSAIWTRMILC